MTAIALVNPKIYINDVNIHIVPNTFTYDEGLGEQDFKVRVGGDGTSEPVFFKNAETNYSMLTFTLFPTDDILDVVRLWKAAGPINLITASEGSTFHRSFTGMALTNNYKVEIGNDKTFELEWKGNPAV